MSSQYPWVRLETVNCIATGEPAVCWSGHVKASIHVGDGKTADVMISAGWKDTETMNKHMVPGGYIGPYRSAYGIRVAQLDEIFV